MTPAEFKRRREALGYTVRGLAVALNVDKMSILAWGRKERTDNLLTLAIAHLEQLAASGKLTGSTYDPDACNEMGQEINRMERAAEKKSKKKGAKK